MIELIKVYFVRNMQKKILYFISEHFSFKNTWFIHVAMSRLNSTKPKLPNRNKPIGPISTFNRFPIGPHQTRASTGIPAHTPTIYPLLRQAQVESVNASARRRKNQPPSSSYPNATAPFPILPHPPLSGLHLCPRCRRLVLRLRALPAPDASPSARSLRLLEWGKVCDAVASFAGTAHGRETTKVRESPIPERFPRPDHSLTGSRAHGGVRL